MGRFDPTQLFNPLYATQQLLGDSVTGDMIGLIICGIVTFIIILIGPFFTTSYAFAEGTCQGDGVLRCWGYVSAVWAAELTLGRRGGAALGDGRPGDKLSPRSLATHPSTA